jgi:YD repeat-containing protein
MDTPIKTIIAWARDGRAIYFAGPDLLPESGEKARLTENTDGTYTLTRPDDIKETYDSYGRLLAVTDLNGNTQTLFYEDGQLISVTDPFGRTLSFDYNGAGQLEHLSDSSRHTIQYQYDTENNLIGVIYPDGSSKTYHYEDTDIHNLTGITNEKGIRYATYAYDSQDRATLSTHADDADRTTVSYGYHTSTVSDGEGNSTTIDWLTKEGVGLATGCLIISQCYVRACKNRDRVHFPGTVFCLKRITSTRIIRWP